MPINVTGVFRYPVKSCRGQSLEAGTVEPQGLAGDRRWMLVDDAGACVTAREHPGLVLVTPEAGDRAIDFTAPGRPDLRVRVPGPDSPERIKVTVWSSPVPATPAGEEAAAWFTAITGKPVRLVYLDDPASRPVDPLYSEPGDRVSFADGYPLLLTSERSLEQLNDWILEGPHAAEGPLPMTRFRPSVVVGGDLEPWVEDGWKRLRIGGVEFRGAKGCDRCVFTTIDPVTAVKSREPLVTLAKYRRWGGKIWFGLNLIPDLVTPAPIRVGDPVEIIS